MKKFLFFMTCAAAMTSAMTASAASMTHDGINYDIIVGNKVEVAQWDATNQPDRYVGDIVIPETFTENGTEYTVIAVGRRAFYYCFTLTSVQLPSTVTWIKDQGFCSSEKLTSVSMPGVKEISAAAFQYSNNISTFNIPASCTTIADGAFMMENRDNSLKREFIVDPENPVFESYEGSLYTKGCAKLITPAQGGDLAISENCQIIGANACALSGFSTIDIPASVTEIEATAFNGCRNLTTFTGMEGVKTIGNRAFAESYNITNVPVMPALETIGNDAFICFNTWGRQYNNKMTAFTFGPKVQKIESEAFVGCPALLSITCQGMTPPEVADNAFESTTIYAATLYYPEEAAQAYKDSPVWGKFDEQQPTGIKDIEVNEAGAQYFDLQGREVKNPQNGLYIRRAGNKVTKVIL